MSLDGPINEASDNKLAPGLVHMDPGKPPTPRLTRAFATPPPPPGQAGVSNGGGETGGRSQGGGKGAGPGERAAPAIEDSALQARGLELRELGWLWNKCLGASKAAILDGERSGRLGVREEPSELEEVAAQAAAAAAPERDGQGWST
ncbi:Hypothetical predicted protein [Podarcis lilfordi]|uniref:Uncharacterized protein n=1 Tax=Podarcis lilfordi TaxID=74358 RepID=A0AA35JYT9_9SAUR|nr:Hypothetical predicted protein [Podarcis lilfordi]